MIKKILILIAILVLILAGYKAFQLFGLRKGRVLETAVVQAETAKVQKKDIWDSVEAAGEIHGSFEAQVFSGVPGKVNSRIKPVGSRIDKNEVLIRVDSEGLDGEPSLENIKSPLKGIITRYFVQEGETIFPDFPLAEVASIERVKLFVRVSQKDYPKLQNGLAAIFYVPSYPEKPFSGKLSGIGEFSNTMAKTSAIEIEVPNTGYILKPGMNAKIEIHIKLYPNSLIVPMDAVMFDQGAESSVYVVGGDKIARLRKVKLGLEIKGFAQVLSGLSEGEEVVTASQTNIKEGMKIKEIFWSKTYPNQ